MSDGSMVGKQCAQNYVDAYTTQDLECCVKFEYVKTAAALLF